MGITCTFLNESKETKQAEQQTSQAQSAQSCTIKASSASERAKTQCVEAKLTKQRTQSK